MTTKKESPALSEANVNIGGFVTYDNSKNSQKAQRPAPCKTTREEANNYHTVIFKTETYRVIPCKDGIQWILQRREGLRHGQPRWASISYCTTRKALIRVWHAKTGDYNGAVELGRLPERIGGIYHGK